MLFMFFNYIKQLYQRNNNVKIMKNKATAGLNVNINNKAVLTMFRGISCLYAIIVLVVIDSFFLDYVHNVSSLIFVSCYTFASL